MRLNTCVLYQIILKEIDAEYSATIFCNYCNVTFSDTIKDAYSTFVLDLTDEAVHENIHLFCLVLKQEKTPDMYNITWTRNGQPLSNKDGLHLWLKVIIFFITCVIHIYLSFVLAYLAYFYLKAVLLVQGHTYK